MANDDSESQQNLGVYIPAKILGGGPAVQAVQYLQGWEAHHFFICAVIQKLHTSAHHTVSLPHTLVGCTQQRHASQGPVQWLMIVGGQEDGENKVSVSACWIFVHGALVRP